MIRSADEAGDVGVDLLRLLPERRVDALLELHQLVVRDLFLHVVLLTVHGFKTSP